MKNIYHNDDVILGCIAFIFCIGGGLFFLVFTIAAAIRLAWSLFQ